MMTRAGNPPEVIGEWLAEGRRFAAATLVETVGSAPLDPGAVMLIDEVGNIEGSVTGGCVEGALVEEAREVLDGGAPRLRTYGISDDEAAGVGLMCGGTVRVFVEELGADAGAVVARALAASRRIVRRRSRRSSTARRRARGWRSSTER
jgi:xanthine/CO dehydrogenase XdhC/CoxF family maturation factor